MNTINRINQLAREMVLKSIPGRRDTCLQTCMVLGFVFESLNFQHQMVPVKCEVRNNRKGDEYWGVGIDKHMVVVCYNQIMLDPSLDQADRPEHYMKLTPLVHESPYVDWLLDQGMILEHSGCNLRYHRIKPWHLSAPDYVLPHCRDMAMGEAAQVLDQLRDEGLIQSKP